MLAVRETKVEGHYKQSFKVPLLLTLEIEKQADKPGSLNLFYRWQDTVWKG